jgi:hypothetical protein
VAGLQVELPLNFTFRRTDAITPLMKTQFVPVKPWHKLGISKKLYSKAKPWKRAKMSRAEFERIIMHLPQDMLDEARISMETEALVEGLFGEGMAEER